MSANQQLPLFDIFAGIGGFSLALQPEFRTVAYCEREPAAIAVLQKNMKSGRLHQAPIYADVLQLTEKDFNHHKPFVISMGFPCQDISHVKKEPDGIHGARSGTIFHVIDIAKRCPYVRMMLIENSPALRFRGLDLLKRKLTTAGFKLSWGIFGACDVASPQRRLRWFGVAFRAANDFSKIPRFQLSNTWKAEPRLCRTVCKTAAIIQRLELLGNAVVPACARFAFANIVQHNGAVEEVVFKHVYDHLPLLTMKYPNGEVATRHGWSTPVKTQSNPCHRPSHACNWLLTGNVLYVNEEPQCGTAENPAINPMWLEWLQGYPANYTAAGRTRKV